MPVIVVEKIEVAAKIFENSDFCQHFRKLSRFYFKKNEYFDAGPNF